MLEEAKYWGAHSVVEDGDESRMAKKVIPESREALNEVYALLIQRSMERKVAAKINDSQKPSSTGSNQVQTKTDW